MGNQISIFRIKSNMAVHLTPVSYTVSLFSLYNTTGYKILNK